MFIKAQSAKIVLNRRSAAVPPSTVTWYNEIFNVTEEVISTRSILLAITPIIGSELITMNGLMLYRSTDSDYSMNTNEIIFTNELELTIGDTIRARYQT